MVAVRSTQPDPPGGRGGSHAETARWEQGDTLAKQLALVIDLNVCVGCHACVTSCKEWKHVRHGRAARRRARLRRGAHRHVLQPRADLRSRHLSRCRHDPLPEELSALRRPAVRAGVPDRRELQAQGRRHRAGRLRQVHRLQVLCVGLSVRRPRTRRRAPGDDQVHALRRPRPTTSNSHPPIASPPASRPARHRRTALRRREGSRLRGLEGDPRTRRLSADARMEHAAGEPVPAAAQDRRGRRRGDRVQRRP